MTTSIITLEGTALYAKIFEDNRDLEGYEGEAKEYGGVYTIDVVLNDVELAKLHEAGSKLEGRDNEEGQRMVKFKRKHEVRRRDTGEVIDEFSGPPRIVDSEGVEWKHSLEKTNYVGNGSLVTVALSITPDKKRPSIAYTRLEGVKVNEHKEYDPNSLPPQMQLPF